MSAAEVLVAEIEIPVPWGHIAAKTYGKITGRPVLAVHDWLDNAGSFDKLGPLLSDTNFIVAIDLPGHGKSTKLADGIGYHLLDMVPVLNRIITHFKWKRVSILGHGIGAGLALLYSSVYSGGNQDHLAKLVLLNSIKPPSVDDEGGAPIIAAALEELLNFDQNVEMLPATYEECMESYLSENKHYPKEDIAKTLMIRGATQDSEGNWSLSRDTRLKIGDTIRLTHEQCFNLLHQMKTPALAIMTPHNEDLPSNNDVQKAKSIYQGRGKSFRIVQVEGSHYIHLTQPETIVKTISEFLSDSDIAFRDYL